VERTSKTWRRNVWQLFPKCPLRRIVWLYLIGHLRGLAYRCKQGFDGREDWRRPRAHIKYQYTDFEENCWRPKELLQGGPIDWKKQFWVCARSVRMFMRVLGLKRANIWGRRRNAQEGIADVVSSYNSPCQLVDCLWAGWEQNIKYIISFEYLSQKWKWKEQN
jgi:hypothetical protein